MIGRLCAACVVAASLISTIPATSPDQPDLVSRLLQTTFARVNRVGEIPPEVVSAASALLGGRKLADPDYFEKAAGAEASSSAPRLLFAGGSRSIWFVHYTRGGRAAGYDLLVLSTSAEGQVVAQAHLASATRAWSMPNLKNMLRQGRFKSAAAGPARRD